MSFHLPVLSYKLFLLLLLRAEIGTLKFLAVRIRAKLLFLEAFLVFSSYQLDVHVVSLKWRGPEKTR